MLGLYQIWTVPVTTGIIKANQMLAVSMDSYSDQLLPALQQAMTANIEGVDASIATFNDVQLQNATLYNQQKCERQLKLASTETRFFCFQKYIACDIVDDALNISACTDCYKGGAAMYHQRQRAHRQGVRRPRDQRLGCGPL